MRGTNASGPAQVLIYKYISITVVKNNICHIKIFIIRYEFKGKIYVCAFIRQVHPETERSHLGNVMAGSTGPATSRKHQSCHINIPGQGHRECVPDMRANTLLSTLKYFNYIIFICLLSI